MGISVNSDSSGNNIHDNDFSDHSNDGWDQSSGAGTAGTANTWVNDIGTWAIPDEICDPAIT